MAMIYGNMSGSSGVHSYDVGPDWIEVTFRTGKRRTYRYTYASAGKSDVEFMKRLAAAGFGLNGYINKHVKHKYV